MWKQGIVVPPSIIGKRKATKFIREELSKIPLSNEIQDVILKITMRLPKSSWMPLKYKPLRRWESEKMLLKENAIPTRSKDTTLSNKKIS
jgi:hypothetical protein